MRHLVFILGFSGLATYAQTYSTTMLNNTEWEVNNWFGDDTVVMRPIKFPTDSTLTGERKTRQQSHYWLAYKIEFDDKGKSSGIHSTSFLMLGYSWALEKFKVVNDQVQIELVKYQPDHLAGATRQTFVYQVVEWTKEKIVLFLGH